MDPIFTLSYAEFSAAQQLARVFPPSKGYSLYIPLSRQEKGVDLILARRLRGSTRATTIQVKSSRTYSRQAPTKRTARPFRYYTWFNTFEAPPGADYVLLVAVYPPEEARASRQLASWWAPVIMAFNSHEIRRFLRSVKTRGGKPDRMFGFGFDGPHTIVQTRGDEHGRFKDFSQHLLKFKSSEIRGSFSFHRSQRGADA